MPDVNLRHSEPEDCHAIKKIYDSPLAQAATLQLPYQSAAFWVSRMAETPKGLYSLVAEVEGDIVGNIGLEASQRPRRSHTGSLGMAVRDDFQGRGIGTELLRAATDLADNWLNLVRLELTVYTDNDAAIALYRKFGFRIEGEMPQFAFRQGRFVDAYQMGRIRGE